MEMKFRHTINGSDVREFCIKNNLYTTGKNKDYDYASLLNSCDTLHNCTLKRMINIAMDIIEHSDPSDAKIDLSLENIAYYLYNDVMNTTLKDV